MLRRRNPYKKYIVPSLFGVGIVISLATSFGDIQSKQQGFSDLSKQANREMFETAQLELSTENLRKQQAISAERIKNFGCRAMVNRAGSALASLRPETQVTNRGVKTPLAPGNCVVGANGETGIIQQDGTIGQIAAGRPEYAQQALKRVSGAGKVYYFHAKGEGQ